MTLIQPEEATKREKALAWSVHLYTASGALWGLLAILAIVEGNWRWAFVWMCITVFIDAVDGTLARKFRVKDVVPTFDGELLDNIVDYFTYVLVPAVVIYWAEMVPEHLMFITIAMITLSSAYQFCQIDAKSDGDNFYFKGFPSYWNLLAIYIFWLDMSQTTNFIIFLVCAILVFVPIKFIYPTRTKEYKRLTLTLNMFWGFAFLGLLALHPNQPGWLLWGSLLYLLYYIVLSVYLTLKPSS